MFIRVKTSSKEECSRSLALRSAQVSAQDMGTGADRGRSSQHLCWVYTSRFLNRPRSGSPRHLYSDLSCHIKDGQNAIYHLKFLKKQTNRKTCTEIYIYIYIYMKNLNIYNKYFNCTGINKKKKIHN